MLQGLIPFITYLGTAVALLATFIFVYVKFTPYHEFDLIKEGNAAAGITLGGALLGFTFPLVSSIYYTQTLFEMFIWAGITCAIQLAVFVCIRKYADHIKAGNIAPAIFMASLSVAVGLLNAVSISH